MISAMCKLWNVTNVGEKYIIIVVPAYRLQPLSHFQYSSATHPQHLCSLRAVWRVTRRYCRDKSGAATALAYDGDASSVRNLVSRHLVVLGLARLDKKSGSKSVSSEAAAAFEAMKEEEALAHADEGGIWRYGDCGDSDDEERRPVANDWGKRK